MKIEIVGSHRTCAPCRKLSEALVEKGVDFTFYDMESPSDEDRFQELTTVLRSKGVRTIPALFINGDYQQVPTAQDKLIELGVL